MKPRAYFTLVCRDTDGQWHDAFGSYSREEVMTELEDQVAHYARRDMKVIRTDGSSASLIEALAKLAAQG